MDFESRVKAIVHYQDSHYTVDLTSKLSDRAYEEIDQLIKQKLYWILAKEKL